MSPPILEARRVSIAFGGLKALTDFTLELSARELVGLIGPNGAGKTTAFNVLTGVYQPTAGEVVVAGEVLNGLKAHQVTARGLARTFQNIRLFKELSALDNVRIGCHHTSRAKLWQSLVQTPFFRREEAALKTRARELLALMDLGHRENALAKNLPYGEQRRLEIARALATGPKCLLLDEPAAGTNSKEKLDLMALIRRLRDELGLPILLIEHDMKLVMGICERIIVLDHGVEIAHGTPDEVRKNPKVIEAYLGEQHGATSAPETVRAP